MKTLIAGVLFRNVERFAREYFDSLNNQTDCDFDTIIILDKTTTPQEYSKERLLFLNSINGASPADIRFQIIQYAINNKYEVILFSDLDDFYSNNRIKKAKQYLNKFDIYVNNLIPVNEDSKIINNCIFGKLNSNISVYNILDSNFFGLSHTAIKTSIIPRNFYIPSDLIAVDWWLFSILLLYKRNLFFDDKTITYYRQHRDNISGFYDQLSAEKLDTGIKVKMNHYQHLFNYCINNGFNNISKLISEKIVEMNILKSKLKDKNFNIEYINMINKNSHKIKNGWWSDILPINEWSRYE